MYMIIDVDRSIRSKDHRLIFWGPNNSGYTPDWAEAGRYTLRHIEAEPEYYGRPAILVVPVDAARAAHMGKAEVPWHMLLDVALPGRRSLRLLTQIVDDALDRREEDLDRREAELFRRTTDTRLNGRLIGRGKILELQSQPRRTVLLDERERQLAEREEAFERARARETP